MAPESAFWKRRARLLALRANLGFWYARWARYAVACCIVAAPLLLLARRHGGADAVARALCAAWLAAAVFAWIRGRSQWFTLADGLVRLEMGLGLHNRLSAAAAGVGPWPAAVEFASPVRWRPGRMVTPAAFAASLLCAAVLVPVPAHDLAAAPPVEAPVAWREVEEWMAGLKQDEVVEAESLAPFEEHLQELKGQPRDRWYGEASLEASDNLRDEMRKEIRGLAADLDSGAGAHESGEGGEATGLDAAALDRSVLSLRSHALRPRADLLRRLEAASRNGWKLRPLDARALGRSLRECAGLCRLALRECREGDPDCLAVGARGRAGVERGPGTAPVTLDPKATKREPGSQSALVNDDLGHAAVGDLLETSTGRPQVARPAGGLGRGGAASLGQGGDAVGRNALRPEERRLLEGYFK
jgi:hypothetical protein